MLLKFTCGHISQPRERRVTECFHMKSFLIILVRYNLYTIKHNLYYIYNLSFIIYNIYNL